MYSAATLVHRHSGNVTVEELNDELFPLHVPALIFVSVCMVVGFVGNLFVIILYKKKFRRSNHRYFILFLAVTDILACVSGMPFLVASLRLPYLMTSNIACKTIRYFHYFVNNSSGLLLVVIACERFRKICRPFKTQLTNRQTLFICWGVVAFSAVMAVPSSFLYSASPIETGIANVTGHQCYVVDEEKIQKFFQFYMMTLMLETIICICIFAVIYTFIIRKLWQSDQFLDTMRHTKISYGSSRITMHFPSECESHSDNDKPTSSNTTELDSKDSAETHSTSAANDNVKNEQMIAVSKSQTLRANRNKENMIGENETPLMDGELRKVKALNNLESNGSTSDMSRNHVTRAVSDPTMNRVGNTYLSPTEKLAYANLLAKKEPEQKAGKHSKVTARVTVMLFTVSVFFALSFLPHLALMIVASVNKRFVDGLSENELIVFQVFLRIFILNNVVNPIIYLLFDSKFRRYSIEVFRCK